MDVTGALGTPPPTSSTPGSPPTRPTAGRWSSRWYVTSSGRQGVGLRDLQVVATPHGWVDTQTEGIDRERYAARFAPRRPGSRSGPKNRAMARRLLETGHLTPAGIASLPPDL